MNRLDKTLLITVLLLGGIFAVVLMGVYGPGVQASEFVYMQF